MKADAGQCTDDGDCPGAALCSMHPAWFSQMPDGMCICPPTVAITGPECHDFSSRTAAYFTFILLGDLCAGVTFMFAVGLAVRQLLDPKHRKLNAHMVTLLFSAAGSLALTSLLSVSSAAINRDTVVVVNGTTKVDPLAVPQTVLLIFVFFFVTLSCLNVSLMWIQVANAASRLRHVSTHWLNRYRALLYLYYVIFLTLVVYFVFFNGTNLIGVAIVALPAVVFIVVTYLWGWFRLRALLGGASNDKTTSPTASSSKTGGVLRIVGQTALALSVLGFAFAMSLLSFVLVGGWVRGASPVAQPAMIISCLIWDTSALLQATVVAYCWRATAPKRHDEDHADAPTRFGDRMSSSVLAVPASTDDAHSSVRSAAMAHVKPTPR